MDYKDKIAVVTGGAQGIGLCIAEEFQKAGAQVCVIDKQDGPHFVGDLADKHMLEQFAKVVIAKHGHVDYLINNAPSPFYLAKLFAPYFAEGGSYRQHILFALSA